MGIVLADETLTSMKRVEDGTDAVSSGTGGEGDWDFGLHNGVVTNRRLALFHLASSGDLWDRLASPSKWTSE